MSYLSMTSLLCHLCIKHLFLFWLMYWVSVFIFSLVRKPGTVPKWHCYRRAHPFNLPAQPFNLSISDKLWTLEKNKGHFIILELNSGIIKWPLFFSKVHSLSDIDRLKGCAGRLKGCALRYLLYEWNRRKWAIAFYSIKKQIMDRCTIFPNISSSDIF